MGNSTVVRNKEGPLAADDTLKVTALLYLREALDTERYEDCPGLIQTAEELGALPNEISELLAEYVRTLKAGRQNEANPLNRSGRRWF